MLNFTKHKVVEINKSTGLRGGDMLAQNAYTKPDTGALKDYIDNGFIFALDQTDGEIKLAQKTDKNIYLHYTEELFPNQYNIGLNSFTVNYQDDNVAYPRLIKLYVGDVFTTDNFAGDFPTTKTQVTIANGVVTFGEAAAAGNHAFIAVPTTMPNGDNGVELTYVGIL